MLLSLRRSATKVYLAKIGAYNEESQKVYLSNRNIIAGN